MRLNSTELATELIDYFGFSCPVDANFYVCPDTWSEFVGCCTVDPCKGGDGLCWVTQVRPASFNASMKHGIEAQECNYLGGSDNFYACENAPIPFYGCCKEDPCLTGICLGENLLATHLTRDIPKRDALINPKNLTAVNDLQGKGSQSSSNSLSSDWARGIDHQSIIANKSIGAGAVAAISTTAMLLALITLGFVIWNKWYFQLHKRGIKARVPRTGYSPVARLRPAQSSSELSTSETKSIDWTHKPKTLRPNKFDWFIEWVWDAFVTLMPIMFIVLCMLALKLDGKTPSSYGHSVMELTRLAPTVYPIVFASVSGRFFKNLARWSLEQPHGVKLATLEQLFGSQSFAGAFERLFSIRTHVPIGILAFLAWTLSPLGGQSASRILSQGKNMTLVPLYYADPSYQYSYHFNEAAAQNVQTNVMAIYTSCLISAVGDYKAKRDPWQFPKIPQLPERNIGDEIFNVDDDALSRGDNDFASLLGINIQGLRSLDEEVQHDFVVQSSYFNFDCQALESLQIPDLETFNQSILDNKYNVELDRLLNVSDSQYASFSTHIKPWPSWEQWRATKNRTALSLLYFSLGLSTGPDGKNISTVFVFNCSMQTVALETEVHCPSPTNCSASRQKRIDKHSPYPELVIKHDGTFINGMVLLSQLAGHGDRALASPTENFIAGDRSSYSGQLRRNWTDFEMKGFSRRLTTAFNTFWDATLDPLGRPVTNSSLHIAEEDKYIANDPSKLHGFYNSTEAVATRKDVYVVNRLWTGILLTTTMVLQMLAILGLVLRLFIKGPDVLGFASSLTRDNQYVPLPAIGSSLDGPERSRKLRDLRLQLADIRSMDEVGYIAIRAVGLEDGSREDLSGLMEGPEQQEKPAWKPLGHDRLYL